MNKKMKLSDTEVLLIEGAQNRLQELDFYSKLCSPTLPSPNFKCC